jgi:hypothetical protein
MILPQERFTILSMERMHHANPSLCNATAALDHAFPLFKISLSRPTSDTGVNLNLGPVIEFPWKEKM